MNILILGGTGAMGAPLAELLAEEHQIFVTSRSRWPSSKPSLHYLQGDAHDETFLNRVLNSHAPFDAIVDFMAYGTSEFAARVPHLLAETAQYVFLSSSRVYACSEAPLTETSPRLLDVSDDSTYLATDEYALAKARQEDLLKNSGLRNWTIVRPYITYNNMRLQLGVFEKESWLYRALQGRTLLFPQSIAERDTTLTYGGDVAMGISRLIGNERAMGETFHIATPEMIRWGEVLEVYLDTLESCLGKRPTVRYTPSPEWLRDVKKDYYAVCYDRLFDRKFCMDKFQSVCGSCDFLPVKEGLRRCLTRFLQGQRSFQKLHWKYEAYVDRITGEHIPLGKIPGWKNKWRYASNRWLPRSRQRI